MEKLKHEYSSIVGALYGRGMVYGIHIVKPGSMEPDGELTHRIVDRAVKRGLMLFAPVGTGGATIKICPPLMLDAAGVDDAVLALREAFAFETNKGA